MVLKPIIGQNKLKNIPNYLSMYTGTTSRIGNLTTSCHEFESDKAYTEAAQLNKLGDVDGSQIHWPVTLAKTNS